MHNSNREKAIHLKLENERAKLGRFRNAVVPPGAVRVYGTAGPPILAHPPDWTRLAESQCIAQNIGLSAPSFSQTAPEGL